jgi:hypothetical protein
VYPAHLVVGTYPEEIAANRYMGARMSADYTVDYVFVFGESVCAKARNGARPSSVSADAWAPGAAGVHFRTASSGHLAGQPARLMCLVQPWVYQESSIGICPQLTYGFFNVASRAAEHLHALDFGVKG